MENNLQCKEVLAIIDIRGIQKFIFKSSSMDYMSGAESIMNNIITEALKYSVKKIDTPLRDNEYSLQMDDFSKSIIENNPMKMIVIDIVAGNAQIIFKTGELYEKIIRKVSRYFLDNTYGLDFVSCCVEKTDNYVDDVDRLYIKLDHVKVNAQSAHPLRALPIAKIDYETGEAIYKYHNTFGWVSRQVELCLNRASENNPNTLKKIHTAKKYGDVEYIAAVHMDGNNLGMTISKVLRRAKSYEEGIMMRQQIDKNIEQGINKLISKTLEKVIKDNFPDGIDEKEFEEYLMFSNSGGDDINFFAEPHIAMSFVENFYSFIDSIYVYKDDSETLGLSVCAGIAFVNPDTPIMQAHHMAEQCCSSAKATGKEKENLIAGRCGNWIDFDIQKSKINQKLGVKREHLYNTPENINLLLRPLSFDTNQMGSERYYYHVRDIVDILDKIEESDNLFDENIYFYDQQEICALSGASSVTEKQMKILGQPYIYVNGIKTAHWYDAIELKSFVGSVNNG